MPSSSDLGATKQLRKQSVIKSIMSPHGTTTQYCHTVLLHGTPTWYYYTVLLQVHNFQVDFWREAPKAGLTAKMMVAPDKLA